MEIDKKSIFEKYVLMFSFWIIDHWIDVLTHFKVSLHLHNLAVLIDVFCCQPQKLIMKIVEFEPFILCSRILLKQNCNSNKIHGVLSDQTLPNG